MLGRTLLAFSIVCNCATLFGLWIAYEAAPATLQAKIGHTLLLCGAVASIILYALFAIFVMKPKAEKRAQVQSDDTVDDTVDDTEGDETYYKRLFLAESDTRNKYQDQLTEARTKILALESAKPDTSVKDSDPQLEIKFVDLREESTPDTWRFDLINRGKQSLAKFACIEDVYVGSYRVAFRNCPPPIKPFGNHDSISPDSITPVFKTDREAVGADIFTAFYEAWGALKNPKLYEFSIPLKATYQDEARNLFETRCDLVFYPGEHIKTAHGHNAKVVEVKNGRIRKVAAALFPMDWSN
jgi:hypothetical protein